MLEHSRASPSVTLDVLSSPKGKMNLSVLGAGKKTVQVTVCFLSLALFPAVFPVQAAQQAAKPAADQVLGTVTAVNTAEKTFTVKEDKTGTEYTIEAEGARRFLKVPPGEKDLKKAQPIEASQIAAGDRLLARGQKEAGSSKLTAAIVIVMSAGELQQKHESELADWQKRGTRGTAANIDPATKQITMHMRGPGMTKDVAVLTTPETQFTRYAPDSVKYSDAKPSSFTELRPGDQLRVLGNMNPDGTQITAEKVISGSFRTVAATVVSVSPDGKQVQATDIQTKQPVTVALTDDSAVRRLPPMMANRLARQLNPNFKGTAPGANPGPTPEGGSVPPHPRPGAAENGGSQPGATAGAPAMNGAGNGANGAGRMGGDISQMLDRLPKISVSELKPGDAVVISGGTGEDKTHMTAVNIIAGVEPLFASAPPRQGRSSDALGMWNLDIGTPGEQQ
jgi:hypothetical protein